MDAINQILSIFSDQDGLFRFALIILISLYTLFALIILIQIRSLNRIINQVKFSPIFFFLAFNHFLAAIALLVFTVLFL
ncbi:MAG TPA: DUF5657 family protein [Patescibacteria group bacterium]|nr:DUF5657 family protein [Patescibacteria group bacterium]